MDHTPTTPAVDDRPLKILERTPVPEEHKQRMFELVRTAQAEAADEGQELQGEFGKEAVAMIVGCNQFLRLYRGGETPGHVEVLVDAPDLATLGGAGFALQEPHGMIFKMFGWKRMDPMAGDLDALKQAVKAAYKKARASKKPS